MPRTTTRIQPPPPEGYVWSDEAARRLSLSRKTLWNYKHLGKGPKPKLYRGRLIYSIAAIDAYNEAELAVVDTGATERAHESRPPEPRLSRRPASAVV